MNNDELGFSHSLWSATAEAAPLTAPLSSREQADVVIVGAGYTGLSSALHLSEAGKSVIVLEAREIGWGGAGRNGGQVNPGFGVLPSGVRTLYGTDRGERVLKFADGACDLVFDLIARHDIKCAPRRVPYLRAAYGSRGLRETRDWVREWGEFGAPVSLRNGDETQKILGSSFFAGAMEDERGGSLHPLSYVRGLARAALAAGVSIYTDGLARSVSSYGTDWQVKTDRGGVVTARHLLIATNGYTDNLWPGLRNCIVPVASLQSATEPLPEALRAQILPAGHHVSETRRAMVYFRIDENGRFQIGGRGRPFNPTRQYADTSHIRAEAIRIFPELKDVKWDYDWGGLVAITKSHLPQMIALGDNAYAGLGYNGRGVAMATAMGQQLAGLVLGEDVPMALTKGAPFTFHALRNLGIAWHMTRGRFLDRFDG